MDSAGFLPVTVKEFGSGEAAARDAQYFGFISSLAESEFVE